MTQRKELPIRQAKEKTDEPLQKKLVRLNVLLQKKGIASRRRADLLIAAGQVKVDGKIVREMGTQVDPKCNLVVQGKVCARTPRTQTFLFHKPYLTITSRRDPKERPTIFDLPALKHLEKHVQAVGRLDYRSEGLLVLTSDGELALALSHPKYSVEKKYAVLLATQISALEVDTLRKGVMLEDGLAKPLSVRGAGKEKMGHSVGQWVEVVVTEGRNRLVRRMFESLGLQVSRLVRVAIGDLGLPSALEPGTIRLVNEIEKKYLDSLKRPLLQERRETKKKLPLSQQKPNSPSSKRKLSLNDAEYALSAERQARQNRVKVKSRKEAFETAQKEKFPQKARRQS